MEGLARPLTSSGELLLVRGQGLWWHQLQPFELALEPDRQAHEPAGDAGPCQVIDNPQLLQFSSMMLALFGSGRADADPLLRPRFPVRRAGLEPSADAAGGAARQGVCQPDPERRQAAGAAGDRRSPGDETRIRFSHWQRVTLPYLPRSRPILLPEQPAASAAERTSSVGAGAGRPGAASPAAGCCSACSPWRCSAGSSPRTRINTQPDGPVAPRARHPGSGPA